MIRVLICYDPGLDFQEVTRVVSQALPDVPSTCAGAVQGSRYCPPLSRHFTAEELRRGFDCINRQTYVHGLVEHPLGAIVEYPETGSAKGVGIAHRFSVDPAGFSHPKDNIQYSLGDSHGGEPYMHCGGLLTNFNGDQASCFHQKLTCKWLKFCSAYSLPALLPRAKLDALQEASKEIFHKTLGFYCTLVEKGCAFALQTDGEALGVIEITDEDPESESESEPSSLCKGKLVTCLDAYGRSFVQCEHRNQNDRAHLILRTLDEFDIPYLCALLENDGARIDYHEELAREYGYGPRVPCSFSASPSEQKELCPYWHRQSGKLARGVLQRVKGNCAATFDIYTPYNLADCPQVVVICRSPHAHSNPHPVKTPPPLLELFRSLLLELDWKLADATPRKLMLDSAFMAGLRRALAWNKPFDPPLAALHPSLGNLDHVRRYIDELRHVLFPEGTGFEGAELLAAQHQLLPKDEQYVRCAETHTIEDGKTFHLVICMLRSMSDVLVRSKNLSLDTAFKRLNGKWQEFEMETWELNQMKSVIGTRAFTTSQSAQAHLILFTRIFEIAHADTGVPCRFRHIHGEGYELWITDSHKGQALGAGMFCQKLSADLGDVYCPMEPTKLLRTLDPYEHLRRFLRFCTVHNKRNIDKLKPYTTQKVRSAMLSLSSSQVHPDLEGAFRTIENGGRKAKAWLKDKRVGSKFAIPALYQPASLIPLEIWKSAPSTTNGNEQAHRNINRDGVNLTMLGGIMRGMQYDARAMGTLKLHSMHGIYTRDQTATHFRRLQRSLNRHSMS
ncbi:hypothetical protein B0H16DRAFT_1331143 [Mycena metata]|uniref:Uncharacterized protein n=1 Tax=Mycena metata TaxID=1033252 RepID=A0AAD7MQZ8_9AGAR|nr:hypothetical protein B0H16DRAFT_1331143 [Mycena metata]